MKDKKLISSFMLLLAALLWGSAYGIQALLSKYVGDFTIIFCKSFSGFILITYCLLKGRRLDKKTIFAGIIIGIFNGIGLCLQQYALANGNVSKVSFISGLYIIFVPILSIFILKKKPKIRFWFAVAIACAGMYFLCLGEKLEIEFADVVTLASALFFALQIIFIHKYSKGIDTVAFCGVQQITTCLMCMPVMLFVEKTTLFDLKQILIPALYIMIGPGMIGQVLQNTFQRDVDATVGTLIMSLESVFGAISGAIFLDARLTPVEIAGCVLIFISIIIAENERGFKWIRKAR